MLGFLKNSKYTNIIASSALVVSVFAAAFVIADAYVGRTTILAKVLQSVGLCPLPEKTDIETLPLATETLPPGPSGSATPSSVSDAKSSVLPSPNPIISMDPFSTSFKGETGTAGTAGSAGAPGAVGEKGETGATGSSGSAGAAGATGAQGPAGICDLSNILQVNGDLVPALDNVYSLGTVEKRWKGLQLGPGTLWIQDSEVTPPTQVGLTVRSGALLLDGANSLRVGSMQITDTGLTSTNHTAPITLGDDLFNSYVQLKANGLKFKDGTVQTTAILTGPIGPPGDKGEPGESGIVGTVEGYVEVPVCIVSSGRSYVDNEMIFSRCDEIVIRIGDPPVKGVDIIMLQKKK